MAGKGHLFEAARALERSAHEKTSPGFSELSIDARSFGGAVFDYLGFDRVRMADALSSAPSLSQSSLGAVNPGAPLELFDNDTKS